VKIPKDAPIFKPGDQATKLINGKKTNAYFRLLLNAEGVIFL